MYDEEDDKDRESAQPAPVAAETAEAGNAPVAKSPWASGDSTSSDERRMATTNAAAPGRPDANPWAGMMAGGAAQGAAAPAAMAGGAPRGMPNWAMLGQHLGAGGPAQGVMPAQGALPIAGQGPAFGHPGGAGAMPMMQRGRGQFGGWLQQIAQALAARGHRGGMGGGGMVR